MRYAQGCDDSGRAYPIEDPLARRLESLRQVAGDDDARWVDSLLGIADIFPGELVSDTRFTDAVQGYYRRLRREGAAALVAQMGA